MSTGPLYQYSVPCITEDINVLTGYRYTVPTACPNNNTHTINATGIQQINNVIRTATSINQNTTVNVFGYFRVDSYTISINSTGTTTYNVTYPYPVTAYSTILFPTSSNIGDVLNVVALPHFTFAGLVSALATGATALESSSITSLNPGFFLYVTNGVTTDTLGEIVSLGNTGANIGFSIPATNSFSPGAYLQISVPRIKNFTFITTDNTVFGLSRKASTGLPAGQAVQIQYTNNSGLSKSFTVASEVGY